MIRAMSDRDVESVFSIMRRNMEPHCETRGETWNEKNIRRYFLNMEGVVLEERGQVAAFTFYEGTPKGVHIHTLQVEQGRQNGLLGAKLFQWYLELGRNNDRTELTCSVYTVNPAFNMYLKLGFEETRREGSVVHLRLLLASRIATRFRRRTRKGAPQF